MSTSWPSSSPAWPRALTISPSPLSPNASCSSIRGSGMDARACCVARSTPQRDGWPADSPSSSRTVRRPAHGGIRPSVSSRVPNSMTRGGGRRPTRPLPEPRRLRQTGAGPNPKSKDNSTCCSTNWTLASIRARRKSNEPRTLADRFAGAHTPLKTFVIEAHHGGDVDRFLTLVADDAFVRPTDDAYLHRMVDGDVEFVIDHP